MIHSEVAKLNGGFDMLDDVIYWIQATALMKNIDVSGRGSRWGTPFGLSTASCASCRVDAAIAKVLKKWQESVEGRLASESAETINMQFASSSQPESSEYLCKNCTIV